MRPFLRLVLAGFFLAGCSSSPEPSDATVADVLEVQADSLPADSSAPDLEEVTDDDTSQDSFTLPDIEVPEKPDGAPWDLTPYARLRTLATRPLTPLPWPRETETGLATIRDGYTYTGFVPAEGPNWVELDVGPWVGHPIWFDELTVTWEGTPPAQVTATLTVAPGFAPVEVTVPQSGLAVAVDAAPAWGIRIHFEAEKQTRLASIQLTTRHEDLPLPPPVEPAELPTARLAGSGIVEGFYGIPWSWRERHSMVVTLAKAGYDTYLYAPKNDPLHRMEWRNPYSADEMQHFADLAAFAKSVGVKVVFGISPFVDFGPDLNQDQQTLLVKVTQFLEAGFSGVAILADDIEMEGDFNVDQALGALHMDVTNKLLDALSPLFPDMEVWFCPTAYSDERWAQWPEATQYLQQVALLDPAVRVLWTGPDTFSPTLEMADLQNINAAVNRIVAIWDNYWASDGGDGFTGRLPMAVYADRNPDVAGLAILNNPAILGSATRMPVTTAALFQQQPNSNRQQMIDYAVSLESQLNLGLGHGKESEVLAWLFDLFDAATNGHPGWGVLVQDMETLTASLATKTTPDLQLVTRLLRNLARASVAFSPIYHSALDPDLVDDLYWPVQQVQATARTGLLILDLLGQRLANSPGAKAKEAVGDSIGVMASFRYEFCAQKLDPLFAAVNAFSPAAGGFQAPKPLPPPAACSVGIPVEFRPFEACGESYLYGHPAAELLADGTVRFVAPYPGVFELAVLCISDSPLGWAHQIVSLECSAPTP